MGFEIDVIDHFGIFDNDQFWVESSDPVLPSVLYAENHFEDNHETHTVAIGNPAHLIAERWYYVIFHFPDYIESTPATFEVQVQLVGDLEKIRNDYPDLYAKYSSSVRVMLTPWLLANPNDSGSIFFNLRTPDQRFKKEKFFGWPEGKNTGYDRYLWNIDDPYNDGGQIGDYQPYYCGFGNDPWNSSAYNPPDSEDSETGENWYNESVYAPPSDGSNESGGEPDFVVREVYIDHHMKIVRPDDNIEIFTRIKNKGDAASPQDIGIKYWRSGGKHIDDKDDRKDLGTDNIQPQNILPGESKWESKHVTAPSNPGVYNYTVEADYRDEINEIHESNNMSDEYVFEVKKPQFFFSSFFIIGGGTNFDPGQMLQIRAYVDNTGAEPGPDVKLYYYLNGVKVGEDNMRDYNLEPEDPPKEENIYIAAPSMPGTHIISAKIDSNNNVNESNENDNFAQIIITVNDLGPQSPSAPSSLQVISP